MSNIIKVWMALFLAILLMQLANGQQSTVVGILTNVAGFGTFAGGFVMSAFYAGYAAGSIAAPGIVERIGHVRSFGILVAVGVAAMGFYQVSIDPVTWGLVRAVIGFSLSGIFVVAESWLNDQTANETRGRVFSLYILVQLGGLMGGQLLASASGAAGGLPFAMFTALMALCIVPVLAGNTPEANRHVPHPVGIPILYRISPLAFVGVVISGFIWAALMGGIPFYGEAIGLGSAATPILVAMPILGGLICLFPMGWLSDHMDRRAVLIGTASLASLTAVIGLFLGADSLTTLYVVMAIYGALTFPFYSLAVAHMNDRLLPEQRVPASAGLVLLFGLGSILGPMFVYWSIGIFGPWGFFVVLFLSTIAVAMFALIRMLARPGAQRGGAMTPEPHVHSDELPPHPTP